MSNFSSYNNWEGFTINPIDFKDKRSGVRQYVTYMLSRTQSMFKYTNLPETIPARMFELYLQCNGNCVVSDVNGELYAFTGGFGGVPDAYYRPTIYTVANPYLNLTKMYKIDEDCILVKNDSMLIGLLPMFERYATMLVENELTIDITLVMSRLSALLSAQDDKTRASAELVLKRIYDGDFGVISESSLLDGIKSQPYASVGNGYIQNLIEVNQYFKGSWINDIGLQYNANTKRENLTKNETEMNSDYLLPLVDDMLRNRRESINLINEKYGTEITVELAIEENSVQTEDETIDIESNSTQDDSVQTEENNITIEPLLEVVDDIGNIVETVVTDELQDDTEIASEQEFTENIVDGVTELVADILEGGDDGAQITDVE